MKLETLATLTTSPNHDVRQAATKFIIDRVGRGSHYNLLMKNITSGSAEKRDKGLTALRFLSTSGMCSMACNTATYRVLLDVLCEFLAVSGERRHSLDTDWKERTQSEKNALFILCSSLRSHVPEALEAGLVTRWLARYPFGGRHASEREKQKVVNKLIKGLTDDFLMSEIISAINETPAGREQLSKHGILQGGANAMSHEDIWIEASDDDDYHDLLRDDHHLPSMRPEESHEEQALRRRRREAVVVAEAGEPLGQENIFSPTGRFSSW